jgi:arylsulfatase A-like enzyme
MGPDAYSTIAEFRSLPKILADAGYDCGLVGKWHLGKNLEPQEGFTSWITMPHGATSRFYDAEVIENGKVREEPTYLTDLWTQRAVEFIRRPREKPFFLFLSFNGPYGLGPSLTRPARNRHAEYYADKLLPSFPREEMHPWQFNNKQYLNNIDAMRRFAAELSAVDDGVGAVIDELRRQELSDDTLVVFTADQGWTGGQHGIWGMGDHTRPLHAFDGTMHIPLIYRQPGQVPAGVESDVMNSNYDFLPTMLGYLGLADQQAAEPASPGRDYAPLLRGEPLGDWDNVVFYDFENVRAVRTADWKYVERFPDGPHELYDLNADPGEQFNLYGQPRQAEVQAELRERLRAFFTRYASPEFDLWNGGRSKPALLSGSGHHLVERP